MALANSVANFAIATGAFLSFLAYRRKFETTSQTNGDGDDAPSSSANEHVICRNAGQPRSGKRVAIVTGGSRGIGKAICLLLAQQGYDGIVVNYVNSKAKADAVVSAIEKITGRQGTAIAVKADVAIEAEVVNMFNVVKKTFGTITALVNNAATIGPEGDAGTLEGCDPERVVSVFRTNCLGPWLCCREASKHMDVNRGGKGGAIVNISSGSAFIGAPLVYAISKGALNSMQAGLVQTLAKQGIRVNAVSPGITATDMVPPDRLARIAAGVPMKRGAQPTEIAQAAVWFLSDAASYASGANIRVAGGRPMGGAQ